MNPDPGVISRVPGSATQPWILAGRAAAQGAARRFRQETDGS